MYVDGGIGFNPDPAQIGKIAKNIELAGYDGVWSPETGHDPFFPLAIAAEHTENMMLGTGIAVAFARSPMNLASVANDIQLMSKGRLMLGLGSQIKAHIEKRFSMPWSHPAPRMREFILAMRAIWDSWHNGTKLEFRGEFYTHTLMTPFFSAGPNPYGPPKVLLAAVGELMTQVAGEVADGLLVHGFTTERYLKQITMPAVEAGLKASGKSRDDFIISYPAFVATGENEGEIMAATQMVKSQIAFYGSTPAYKGVLELHGWGDLQKDLNILSKQGEWVKMRELIDQDILEAFAIVCEPDQIAKSLLERFGGVVDRISFYAPYNIDSEIWNKTVTQLKAAK